MIKITRQNWWIWLAGTLIFALLIAGFSKAVHSKGLDSSDAAGWMQAIASLAAIAGAFRIVQVQHAGERLLEAERHIAQAAADQDADYTARLLAIENTVQVADQVLHVLRHAVDNARYPDRTYAVNRYDDRMMPLAAILDRFITPDTNKVAVLAALNISLAITAVRENLRRVGGPLNDELFARCDERISEAQGTLDVLINLKAGLMSRQSEHRSTM